MIPFLKPLFLFELMSLLILILSYRKFPYNYMVFLLIILLSTVITEALTILFIKYNLGNINFHFYYSFILFNSIYFFYSKIINNENSMKLIRILTLVFSLSWFLYLFVDGSFNYLLILGSFNTSIYAFLYLKELLMSDRIINYKKVLPFWISVSFLIFYTSSIPFFLIQKQMSNRSFYFILKSLGIIMYSGIIFGLLCSNKEERY
ncbi:membrane protein of unknown function [Tenacibaculum jejuense]|uniref:Uncharacterized protein n=1 Tax=Tenacibaculum jejuense TaxID=584609 RepID=A0A238U527_9FLAO|nr:membrane protein of unknown function [Tenacibaculum jejuense]